MNPSPFVPQAAQYLQRAQEVAPIHGNDGTGHVSRRIRRQEQERAVEIARFSQPTLGYTPDHRLSGLAFEEGPVEIGPNVAGRDRVDPDVVPGQLQGHDLGEVDQPRLRGRVFGNPSDGPKAPAGGDVDDAPTLPMRHNPPRPL